MPESVNQPTTRSRARAKTQSAPALPAEPPKLHTPTVSEAEPQTTAPAKDVPKFRPFDAEVNNPSSGRPTSIPVRSAEEAIRIHEDRDGRNRTFVTKRKPAEVALWRKQFAASK